MILLSILPDTIQYINPDPLIEYLKTAKPQGVDGASNMTNIILAIIGFFGTIIGSIFAYIKIREANRQRVISDTNQLTKITKEADIKNDIKFQEKIVFRFFEEYVKQNTWITDQFSTKFEVLLENLQTQNKMMKDIYAQTDTLRREMRAYELNTSNNLKKIEGIVSKIPSK